MIAKTWHRGELKVMLAGPIIATVHSLDLTGVVTQNVMLLRQIRRLKPDIPILVLSPRDGPGRALYEAHNINLKIAGPDYLSLVHRVAESTLLCESLLGWEYAFAGLRCARKVLIRVHEEIPFDGSLDLWSREVPALPALFASLSPATFIFPTRHTAEYYDAFLRVETDYVVSHGAIDSDAEFMEIAVDEFIILQLGTVYGRKGALETLEAFAQCFGDPEASSARLRFVGARRADSNERRYIASLHSEILCKGLTGMVSVVDASLNVKEEIRKSSLLTLHSRAEVFPSALLEGLAAGRPVVASRVGGIAEMVDEGANGFVFGVGDVTTQAELMLRIFLSRSEWVSKGPLISRDAIKRFHVDGWNHWILQLFLES